MVTQIAQQIKTIDSQNNVVLFVIKEIDMFIKTKKNLVQIVLPTVLILSFVGFGANATEDPQPEVDPVIFEESEMVCPTFPKCS